MKVSILVPWRANQPRRAAVWDWCRAVWGETGYEVVAADDGLTGPFSRSRAYNRAFTVSTGDVVIPMGANHIAHQREIEAVVKLAVENGWCRTFDHIANITPVDTDRLLAGEPFSLGMLLNSFPHPMPSSCAMTREAWNAVGGYDERFGTGYGYEDAAIRNALAHKLGVQPSGGAQLISLDHGDAGLSRIDPKNHELFWSEYANLAPELN
jgi:hypothetical protein